MIFFKLFIVILGIGFLFIYKFLYGFLLCIFLLILIFLLFSLMIWLKFFVFLLCVLGDFENLGWVRLFFMLMFILVCDEYDVEFGNV